MSSYTYERGQRIRRKPPYARKVQEVPSREEADLLCRLGVDVWMDWAGEVDISGVRHVVNWSSAFDYHHDPVLEEDNLKLVYFYYTRKEPADEANTE